MTAALPRHIGIIMDGNGRWAQLRDQPRIEGHRVGAESVRDITRAARELGVEALTLYAFSVQNWARPGDEVAALMDLLRDYLRDERPEIMDNQIRLHAIGDLDMLPPSVRAPLDALRADSAGHRGMTLTLALSYGGRESLAAAARALAAAVARGELTADAIDVDRFAAALPTRGLPPVDLLIRTSGEQRISNFLLWESAYAELMFVDVMWPDFRRRHLYECLDAYGRRERRFGLTSAQLASDLEPSSAPAAAADDADDAPSARAAPGGQVP
jgi:undecaprenyl diphosphate synthase